MVQILLFPGRWASSWISNTKRVKSEQSKNTEGFQRIEITAYLFFARQIHQQVCFDQTFGFLMKECDILILKS